jgi:hypothetical protein
MSKRNLWQYLGETKLRMLFVEFGQFFIIINSSLKHYEMQAPFLIAWEFITQDTSK